MQWVPKYRHKHYTQNYASSIATCCQLNFFWDSQIYARLIINILTILFFLYEILGTDFCRLLFFKCVTKDYKAHFKSWSQGYHCYNKSSVICIKTSKMYIKFFVLISKWVGAFFHSLTRRYALIIRKIYLRVFWFKIRN